MKTPAGKECRYFFGDYFRGRSREECRLLAASNLRWKRDMCNNCPVPEILLANECSHMVLEPSLERPFPFFTQQVRVNTYCVKTERRGFDPHIGCGDCHPLPSVFTEDHP